MPPDPDDLRRLGDLLSTRRFGRAHEHHETLSSTNDRAAAWARSGAPHGAVVTADAQTAGRGRRGRSWHSASRENLYASVIVRARAGGPGLGALGLAAAVGLCEGMPDVGVVLKWPNDLLVGGRKIGGILCEARWSGGVAEAVVGFGINVGTRSFPGPLAAIATSLASCMDAPLGRAELLARLLGGLEDAMEAFLHHGFAAVRERYVARCSMLGTTVALENGPGKRVEVLAEGLDPDGALRVRPPGGGPSWRVESSDVWLVEPPDPGRLTNGDTGLA